MRTISHQIQNINKETEIIKKEVNWNSQDEKYKNWNKKLTRIKVKSSADLISQEKRIIKLEDKSTQMIKSE